MATDYYELCSQVVREATSATPQKETVEVKYSST